MDAKQFTFFGKRKFTTVIVDKYSYKIYMYDLGVIRGYFLKHIQYFFKVSVNNHE